MMIAGVGVGLLREKLAIPALATGQIEFLEDHSVDTNLEFAYPLVGPIPNIAPMSPAAYATLGTGTCA